MLEVAGRLAEKNFLPGWQTAWLVCSWALGTQDYAAERGRHVGAVSVQRGQEAISGQQKLVVKVGVKDSFL